MFTVMELPSGGAEDIAEKKVNLLKCISELKMDDTVLGQFEGYLADDTVPEGSVCPCDNAATPTAESPPTPPLSPLCCHQTFYRCTCHNIAMGIIGRTYAAVSIAVDNERWAGVPMMITAGKGLSERTCTMEATFKPGLPYTSLLLRIQPNPVRQKCFVYVLRYRVSGA